MNIKRILLLVVSIVAILAALALVMWGFRELSGGNENGEDRELINDGFGIASFEECEAAGYPVMESYPRQCRTPDGTVFIEGGGVEPGDQGYNGEEGLLQTPAGPLFLTYENGYVRLRGTLQKNDACVNWVIRGEVKGGIVTFRVDPERLGEVCAQVISQQQVESLVQASSDANVNVILEGDMVIYSGPVS